ncbi:MAG: nitroreductase family protein [Paludibacter sp.]|nr:nitroreductase family protein [Paludibacter sp.]
MDIINSIVQRKSCRTFSSESLKPSDKKQLEEFINTGKNGLNGETVDFILLEKSDTDVQMKIPYGLIRGNKTYIFGEIRSSPVSRINYGYLLEKIVLKATELHLGTCWVGMFDREYFNDVQIETDLVIPGILVIGYASEKIPVKEKLIRRAVNADKRKPWESLFFNYETKEVLKKQENYKYVESLLMTRLAPSSGNTQPWRIYYSSENNEFHFFKKITNQTYELKGLHDIDMGIAMSHFELVSLKNGLKGDWQKNDISKINTIDDLQYTMSWKCEN